MLSKIPANAKPVIAIVGLALAAVLIWFALSGGQKAINDPIVIDLSNGNIRTMSHDEFRRTAARSGNERRIFPVELSGDGGLRIHNRYRSDFVELIQSYGITKEQASQYLDFSNESWPRVKDDLVPGWAKSARPASIEHGNQPDAGAGQDAPVDR